MIKIKVTLFVSIVFYFSSFIAQTNPDSVIIKDVDGNNLLEFIDEGSEGTIVIPQMDKAPLDKINKLYNAKGELYYNGVSLQQTTGDNDWQLSSQNMYSKPSGNVGIGVNPPTEKLDVDGNIKISGEINSPETGTSNLLPIAYGIVNVTGNYTTGYFASIITSTGNTNHTITTAGVNGVLFNITVNNIPFNNNLVPIVSLLSANGAWQPSPTVIYSELVGNILRVQLRYQTGDDMNHLTQDSFPTNGKFSFVIYNL